MHIIEDQSASVLFGKTRRGVLTLLLENPDHDFYMGEIASVLGVVPGAIQRELAKLVGAGILTRRKRGKQVYFQADRECPIFPELRRMVTKTSGLIMSLQAALNPLREQIRLALVYGSFASGEQGRSSDVDLLVVGEISYADVIAVLTPVEDRAGREINPTVYSSREFAAKMGRGNRFVQTLLAGPTLPLIGRALDAERLADSRVAASSPRKPRRD